VILNHKELNQEPRAKSQEPRQKTKDKGQKTKDKRQKTKDKRQKTKKISRPKPLPTSRNKWLGCKEGFHVIVTTCKYLLILIFTSPLGAWGGNVKIAR
jgi:hypothetical protein